MFEIFPYCGRTRLQSSLEVGSLGLTCDLTGDNLDSKFSQKGRKRLRSRNNLRGSGVFDAPPPIGRRLPAPPSETTITVSSQPMTLPVVIIGVAFIIDQLTSQDKR